MKVMLGIAGSFHRHTSPSISDTPGRSAISNGALSTNTSFQCARRCETPCKCMIWGQPEYPSLVSPSSSGVLFVALARVSLIRHTTILPPISIDVRLLRLICSSLCIYLPYLGQVSNMGGFTDLHVEANVLWGVSGHSELLLWDIRASATPVRAVNLDSSFAHHLKAARVSRILGLQSSSTPISRSSLSRNSAGILSTPDSQLLFIPRASGHCQAFDRRMLSKLRPLSMFSVFPVPRDPSSHQRTSPGQLSSSNSISSSSSSSPERTSAESAGVIQAHTSPGRGSRRPRFGEGPTSLSCAILDSQNPDFLLYQLLDSTVGCYDISTGEAVPLYTPLITQFYDSFSFRRTRACGITSVARPHLNPTLCYGGRSNT